MLVALLEIYLQHGYQLFPEFLLTRLPQRIDIVVVRKTGEEVGRPRKIRTILDFLGLHTIIEHKGPTDELAGEDALVLLGYAAQYMRLCKVKEPADVRLMVVADRIPRVFVKQIVRMGGSLAVFDTGLWRGQMAGLSIHGVETGVAYKRDPDERLLYAFSRAFLREPSALLPLEGEDRSVYHSLYQQVEQFRRLRGDLAMKDLEEIRKAAIEIEAAMMRRALAKLTPEERLAGLSPEQLVDLVAHLPPEVLEAATKKRSS